MLVPNKLNSLALLQDGHNVLLVMLSFVSFILTSTITIFCIVVHPHNSLHASFRQLAVPFVPSQKRITVPVSAADNRNVLFNTNLAVTAIATGEHSPQ